MAKKKLDLGKDSIGKLIARLAIPSVLAQVIFLLYNMIDRMYVGNIEGYGTQALAGLGVAMPVIIIIGAFGNLVGMGGAPLASIFLGEQKKEEAGKVFNSGVGILLVFSVLLTIVITIFCGPLVQMFGVPTDSYTYARDYLFIYGCGTIFVLIALGFNPFITAQGYSITSMITVSAGAALNIILDPIFIFTLNMGVRGAAWATVISQAVSAIWVLIFFCGKKTAYRLNVKQFFTNVKYAGRILLLGLSPFIMTATESAIQIVFNVNLKFWSGDNSNYTAALTIMLTALQMSTLPLNGLGAGVQPLVSYNYGTGDSKRIWKTVRYCTVIAFIFAATVWGISVFSPQVYGYLFNAEAPVMEVLCKFTPFFMMGTICFFAQSVYQCMFVALNQAPISIFLACLRKLILLIPLCYALPYVFDVAGIFYSEGISDLIAGVTTAVMFLVMLPRILKKRERLLAQQAAEQKEKAEEQPNPSESEA